MRKVKIKLVLIGRCSTCSSSATNLWGATQLPCGFIHSWPPISLDRCSTTQYCYWLRIAGHCILIWSPPLFVPYPIGSQPKFDCTLAGRFVPGWLCLPHCGAAFSRPLLTYMGQLPTWATAHLVAEEVQHMNNSLHSAAYSHIQFKMAASCPSVFKLQGLRS